MQNLLQWFEWQLNQYSKVVGCVAFVTGFALLLQLCGFRDSDSAAVVDAVSCTQ